MSGSPSCPQCLALYLSWTSRQKTVIAKKMLMGREYTYQLFGHLPLFDIVFWGGWGGEHYTQFMAESLTSSIGEMKCCPRSFIQITRWLGGSEGTAMPHSLLSLCLPLDFLLSHSLHNLSRAGSLRAYVTVQRVLYFSKQCSGYGKKNVGYPG